MSIKSIFIRQIDNFMNELYLIFPQSSDILLLKEKYNLIKSINSKLIIDYIIYFIYPHKDKIIEEDESFFLEGGGQDELKDTSGLKFRDNIKTLWIREISDENKEIILKYFKIFVLLSEKQLIENEIN